MKIRDILHLLEEGLPPTIYLKVSRTKDDPEEDENGEIFEPDEDGTIVTAHTTTRKDSTGGDLVVGHLHVPDERVGRTWSAGDVSVSPDFQRLGVARAMYARMTRELGVPAEASTYQTPAARAMWSSGKIGT